MKYHVNAAKCPYTSPMEEVYETIKELSANLDASWERIAQAGTVLVKFNDVYWVDQIELFEGQHFQSLVDLKTMRAVLRLLRERTGAHIMVMDTSLVPLDGDYESDVFFKDILREYGAEFVNASLEKPIWVAVPGGGTLFGRYMLHPRVAEAGAVVSVAKMKCHGSAGVTLCMKNLFGLTPVAPYGRVRTYFHHSIRLPYVLADLGAIFKPCLNVVDAMVCQSGREWRGQGVAGNCIIVGDNVTATDACGTALMGFDPTADWPKAPFYREHNHIKISAGQGTGTNVIGDIDFHCDIPSPIAQFATEETFEFSRALNWHKSCIEQALYYRDNAHRLLKRYENEYIYLHMNKVVWHGSDPTKLGSRSKLCGDHPDETMWLKFMDPENREDEHYELYENIRDYIEHL